MANGERIVLDPAEVAEGRAEFDLTPFMGEEGPDWGDGQIAAYQAEQELGEVTVDYRIPNRQIALPLALMDRDDMTFDEARAAVQATAALFMAEGGWLKREIVRGAETLKLYADVDKASLKLGGSSAAAYGFVDADAVLTIDCLPDWYGDEVALAQHFGTNGQCLFVEEDIAGSFPLGNRCRIVVTGDSDGDQRGIKYGIRSRSYSDEETAALTYPAYGLMPVDLADVIALSGAVGGVAIRHNNLGTDWTPVLATDLIPTIRSFGAAASGTGGITPALPAGYQAGDILVLPIETQNEAVSVPGGWAHVPGSPVSNAVGTATRLTVLWKRATASETAPAIVGPGDHIVGRMFAVKGCVETGSPWDVTAAGTEATSDTSVSIPGGTTTVDGCLVLAMVATGVDTAIPQVSSPANPDLRLVTTSVNSWVGDGGGGGVGVISGIKQTKGVFAATTATVASAAEKAMLSMALKPAVANQLTHTGTVRVEARVYTTSPVPPELRWVYDTGDLVNPSENNKDAKQIPGSNNFWLVDLGEIRLGRSPVGAHRWRGQLQARGAAGGENVAVDRLRFWPVDEGYARVTVPARIGRGLNAFIARDPFDQSAGALSSKTAPIGGNWDEFVDVDDLTVNATGHTVERTAVSDGSPSPTVAKGQACVLDGSSTLTDVVVSTRCKVTSINGISPNFHLRLGVTARFVDANNFLFAGWDPAISGGLSGSLIVYKVIAGTPTILASAVGARWHADDAWQTVTLAVRSDGTFVAVFNGAGGEVVSAPGYDSVLAAGGTLDDGKIGLYDYYGDSLATTRTYDDFSAWVPEADAAIFAGRKTQLRTDGTYRETADGVGAGLLVPFGSHPRLPQSGPQGRSVEILVATTRGDFDRRPDAVLDDVAVQAFYRPCWLTTPVAS